MVADFTPEAWMSFVLLGMATVAHLFLINLVLGLSIIIPIFEGISIRRRDPELDTVNRRLFRYMILSDLFAGVWATWMVIILAGLWPIFTFTVTRVLFIPLLIGLLGVFISIPTIAVYWYTWDRVSQRIHLLIGVFMAFGALLVPAGFNMIFSYINLPAGLAQAEQGDLYAVFSNPIYWTFTPHRWFGSLTVTGLTVAGIYGYRYASSSNSDRGVLFKASKYSLYIGLSALAVEILLGVEYTLLLREHSPYIFATVLGGLFDGGIDTYYNLLPLFTIFIILVVTMGIGGVSLLRSIRRGSSSKYASLAVAFSSLTALPLIEFINDASRAPYIVVQGDTGIHANSLVNPFMKIGWEVGALSIAVALLLTLLFSVFLYIGLARYKSRD